MNKIDKHKLTSEYMNTFRNIVDTYIYMSLEESWLSIGGARGCELEGAMTLSGTYIYIYANVCKQIGQHVNLQNRAIATQPKSDRW